MAQTNFTPILLYASGTPTNVPSAGNLTSSASGAELAVNYADGKLFYKDSGGNVQTLASKATGSIGGSDTQIQYNSSGSLAGSANLTFNGTTLSANALAVSTGNLTFSGTAQRITGDFSNATLANRVAFQTSTTNGQTAISALPNGTSTTTQFVAYNNSDITNAHPAQLISLSTDMRFQAAAITSGTGTYLPMTFYTGGSERVRVDTSGNVGIGTTSPSGNLQVSAGNTRVRFSNTAGTASTLLFGADSGSVFLGAETNAPIYFITNNTERMRIDASGNVGIGTTSPVQAMSVARGAGVPAYATFAGNASADPLFVGEDAAGLARLYTGSTTPISFWTNATERMRIDSSGNVGIGTASPGALFDVGGGGLRVASTGAMTSGNLADAVGYKGTPLNEQSAAYTLVIGDMGKSIVHPITDNNARTFTIPANGTVAFPVGTAITFVNMINTVTIAITTDTMYLAGPGTTGSRTLAAYGMATAVKVTSTSWIISGNGLT